MRRLQASAAQTPATGAPAAIPDREVIVAVEPPLLRDMLSRVIGQIQGLHLRAELAGPFGLAPFLEQTGAQWLIVSLAPDGTMPVDLEAILAGHPSVSVLGIADDGSRLQVVSAGNPIRVMAKTSLALLIGVMLESRPRASDGAGGCQSNHGKGMNRWIY